MISEDKDNKQPAAHPPDISIATDIQLRKPAKWPTKLKASNPRVSMISL